MLASANPTAHRAGPCENSDEVMGISTTPIWWIAIAHLLSCRLLDEACTAGDLATLTERAKACARKWENIQYNTIQHNTIKFISTFIHVNNYYNTLNV